MKGFRRGAILTLSGQEFEFEKLSTWKFSLVDTVHALSLINRYVGHSREPYSVLQHLLWCGENARRYLPVPSKGGLWTSRRTLEALTHDFAEAYLGDVSSPLKSLKDFAGYRALEALVQAEMDQQFLLDFPDRCDLAEEFIDNIDRIAFLTETRDLRTGDDFEFLPRDTIRPLAPAVVRGKFMALYLKLKEEAR